MTDRRIFAGQPKVRRVGLALGLALIAMPGLASASSLDLFYERTVMIAADAQCGLFAGPEGSALAAAGAQARGAAMRAGTTKVILNAVEKRARSKALVTPCNSPDLAVAAGRVRQAFEGYARMIRMDYPGDHAGWSADRSSSVNALRWRLAQDLQQNGDRLVFGLAGRAGANALMAVADLGLSEAPYSARLVIRDNAITAGPYLNLQGSSLATTPLSRRFSPPGAQVTFQAEARSPAGLDLLPKGMTTGWAFRFPAKAAQAISALDPREAVAVDFLFSDDQVRRIYVEVGDFAAGRAFLQVASR